MNLSNATLTRIDTPAPATVGGTESWTAGDTLAVRCILSEPRRSQLSVAEAAKATITASLYVLRSALAGQSDRFPIGAKVLVRLDGDAAASLYFVRVVTPWAKGGGLSHWLLGLEAA